MGILEKLDITRFAVDSADSQHLQIEAMKLAGVVWKQRMNENELKKIDHPSQRPQ